MIKLNRPPAPPTLDAKTSRELTETYAENNNSVWNKSYIKKSLLDSSSNKCAYCETKLDEESKYMEVEHFRCKKDFPEKVVQWENLLPSCKRCNGKKGDYNVDMEGEIINPYDCTPSKHIYLLNYRLVGRDEIGRRTISDALYLNDSERLVYVRMKIGESISVALESIREKLENFLHSDGSPRQRRNILRGVEKLLLEAQPDSQYSAVAATILISEPNYLWIREQLTKQGFWDDLAPLETSAENNILAY